MKIRTRKLSRIIPPANKPTPLGDLIDRVRIGLVEEWGRVEKKDVVEEADFADIFQGLDSLFLGASMAGLHADHLGMILFWKNFLRERLDYLIGDEHERAQPRSPENFMLALSLSLRKLAEAARAVEVCDG